MTSASSFSSSNPTANPTNKHMHPSLSSPLSAGQTILIVDDNPTNIGMLADYLESHGFNILVARDGKSGINKAAYARPDLILLDVMMSGLDGFDTCRLLKEQESTQHIPVIFMTALNEVEHKVHGFAVGAVDYVTKPLQQEEVLARVTTHLRIQALTAELRDTNRELQQLNANKDKFLSIMAHDLRGSFVPLLGSAELLARRIDRLSQEKVVDMSFSILSSAQRVLDLLNNLLQWGRLQMGHIEVQTRQLDLAFLLRQNVNLLIPHAEAKQITLTATDNLTTVVFADEHMLHFVLRNLLTNAIKFTSEGGQVSIHAEQLGTDEVAVTVADTGVGMSQDTLHKLFQINQHQSTVGTRNETGTGLGLILCEEMVRRNNGRIWIESEEGKGTRVTFTLPARK